MSIDVDLAALQLAIRTEKDGHRFYSQAAMQATHSLARETFAAFARDELHHMEIIQSFYAALAGGHEWQGLSELYREEALFAQEMKTIFHRALQNVEQTARATTDDMDAFCLAAQFEREGVMFYSRLAEETSDPQAQKFYEFLRDMEREHLKVIANSLQYLEDPATWYSQQEKWIVEG